MITNFIKGAADQMDNPAVHTIAKDTFGIEKGEGSIRIRRKRKVDEDQLPSREIFDRARMIYLRARRSGMSRASAIF